MSDDKPQVGNPSSASLTASASASFMSVVVLLLQVPFVPLRFLLNLIPRSGPRLAAKVSVCAFIVLGFFYLWALPLFKHGYKAVNDKAAYVRYDEEGEAGPWSATLAFYTIAGGFSLIAVSWFLVGSGRDSIQASIVSRKRALALIENGSVPETSYGGRFVSSLDWHFLRNTAQNGRLSIQGVDEHFSRHRDDGFLSGLSGMPILMVLLLGQLVPIAWGGSINPLWTDYAGASLVHFTEGIINSALSSQVSLGDLNSIATLPVLALVYTLPITWAYNYLGVSSKNILTVNEISESSLSKNR